MSPLRSDERRALEAELAGLKTGATGARERAIASYISMALAVSDLRRQALRAVEIRSALGFAEPPPSLEGFTDPCGVLVAGDAWGALVRDASELAAGALRLRREEAAISLSMPVYGRDI